MNAKRVLLGAVPVVLVMLLAARGIDSDVYEGGEAREALVAREMLETGDWILPLWNGRVVPSKPPLYHWLVAGAARAAGDGVTERALRMPSVVLAGAVVLLVLLFGGEGGWLAALVLATTPQFLTEASDGRVDMTLCAALTGAQLAVVAAIGGGGRVARLALAVCLGLAMLAKGPVGPGLVGLTALAFGVRERNLRPVIRLVRPLPVLVFVALAGSWYAAAYLHRGWDFVAKQILSENGEALLGGERFPYRSALFYLGPLIVGGLPWTLVLPWAVRRAWRGGLLERYAVVWAGVVFVFFSLAPLKRAAYLLPLRPALALVIGSWLAAAATGEQRASRALGAARGLALGAAAAGLAVAVGALAVRRGVLLPAGLEARAARAEIDLEASRQMIVAHWSEIVVLGMGGALAAWLAARALARARWRRAAVATAGAVAAGALLVLGVFVPARAAQKSVRPFALEVRERVPPGEPLALLLPDEEIPFVYYVGRHVPLQPGGPDGAPPGWYVVDRSRWDAWQPAASWQEVARSRHVFSHHRRDLVLVRRR